MARQENRFRELFKRIVRENKIHILFRTCWWDNVNIIHLWKIQVTLKSGLFKMRQKCFFFKIKVEINLDFKAKKFMSCELTWNQDVFQNAPEPVFSNHLNTCISIYLSIDRSIYIYIYIYICMYVGIYIYIYTQPNNLVLIQVKNNTMYWWWLQRVFIPGVFSGRWYNGQKENRTIYIGNKRSLLIGMARIRQLRVRSSKFFLLLLLFAFQWEAYLPTQIIIPFIVESDREAITVQP